MTEFPISTRGPQDSDPVITYQKDEFIHVFSDFLNRPTGTNIEDLNPDYALEKDEAKQLKNSCFGHLFSNA